MSSFVRTIQRTTKRKPNKMGKGIGVYFNQRGSRLGTKNPKDSCLPGRPSKKRMLCAGIWDKVVEAVKLQRIFAIPQPLAPKLSPADRRAAHRKRMQDKHLLRISAQQKALRPSRVAALLGTPASINRHTGKPHQHARAAARRSAKS